MSAAADATVPAVVADLFYFHERGHCMMMFHTAISSGVFLGPLFNAYTTQYAGWRWMCGWMAIVSSGIFLIGIFTIHETAYERDMVQRGLPEDAYAPRKSWRSRLSVTSGYNPNASFFEWLFDTLVLVAYPPVIITGLTIGVFVGW